MGHFFASERAQVDLEDIQAHISLDSYFQAGMVHAAFNAKFQLLAEFPEMAPLSTDWIGARRHTGSGKIQSYYIYYWIHEGAIKILRVIHAKRDQAEALLKDSE